MLLVVRSTPPTLRSNLAVQPACDLPPMMEAQGLQALRLLTKEDSICFS